MDLWVEDMTTSQNYINYTPGLFNGLIAGKLQAQHYTNLPAISTTCIAAAADVQKMLPDTTPHLIMADSLAFNSCTPSFKKLPDSSRLVVVEGEVIANSMQDVNYIHGSSAGINLITLITPGQQIGEFEQMNELWRDRNNIEEAVRSVGKLGDRLQGWNKHQMDAVQATSNVC